MSLYMLRLDLNARALIQFANAQGFSQTHDEDLGYATHAWLAACFGELAPKPFRLLPPLGSRLTLLAYSTTDSTALTERAAAATPAVRGICNPLGLAHNRLPESWPPQAQLGFEVLVCPITRQRQTEKDVFLRHLERLEPDAPRPERSVVYRDWLAAQLGDAARLDSFILDNFHLVRILRRTQTTPETRDRAAQFITRPSALCRGTLSIRDGERLGELLYRGLGRHRAFGYGMLLLRPL